MDILPGLEDPRRRDVRSWIEAHPNPTGVQLAEVGYVAPHLPQPYGLDADPMYQLIIDDELKRAGIKRPDNVIGIGWAAPTLITAGTTEQIEKYVPRILSGEDIWCQLFSEPESGSDLASLRTSAVRDGDEWVINGQKIWTSGAQYSRYGILIARTDTTLPKHKGISYFVCPMDAPGIEIRPIKSMAGAESFNEVFFTDVRISHDNLVGEVNDGWRLAKVTLGNERVGLSKGGVLWGMGPTALDIIDFIKKNGPITDAVMRQRIVELWIEHNILEIIRKKIVMARLRGEHPGPEASVNKILADEHGQKAMLVARDAIGAHAMLMGEHDDDHTLFGYSWYSQFMFSRALTIGGGTGEVQRNILGERVFGLPR
jgi:alkylation response protein AidB-like acyl-CoA dehydrogenase